MKAAHAATEGLRQPWARELLVAFHASLDYDRMPGDMARRVGASGAFLAVLDTALSGVGEIDQTRLLDLHGAEGLRRQERLVAFLVRRLRLPWDGRAGALHSARRVASTALDDSSGTSWHADLATFSTSLGAPDEPLSSRTLKSYISAASGLLETAGVERAADLTQRHVKLWLRCRPGRANDVHRFLSWLKESGGPALDVRLRAGKTIRIRQRDTLQRAKMLLAHLSASDDPREGRALLARAIATIHGLRLEKVLALRESNIVQQPGCVRLLVDDATVELGPTLSDAFRRFTARFPGWLFDGRASIAPCSVDGTRYHLRGTTAMTT